MMAIIASEPPLLLEADWVLPVTGPAVRAGAVVVHEGRLVAVGPVTELRAWLVAEGWGGTTSSPERESPERPPDGSLSGSRYLERRFPGCVIMPGLVNTHSHLEYSAFHGFAPPCGFARWMLRLLLARRKLSPADYAVSAAWGARECIRSGITTVADTSFDGWTSLRAAAEAGLRGRVYLEVIGVGDEAVPTAMERVETKLVALADERQPLLEVGLSPHAPYTVSQRLYRELVRYARRNDLWMATHLAESKAEVELLAHGAGGIARAYKAARLWKGKVWRTPGVRPADYVAATGALGPRTLAVHCVELNDAEVECVAATGAGVAHCPRSNARLQCAVAPVAALRATGASVGLGTDSLASNDSLDMFAEMRAALAASWRRAGGAPPTAGPGDRAAPSGTAGAIPPLETAALVLNAADVFRMATIEGATAIGLDDRVGSLEVGKRADVIAVRLPPGFTSEIEAGEAGATAALVEALVAEAGAGHVVATVVDGRVVFDAERENGAGATQQHAEIAEVFVGVRARLGLSPQIPRW